MQTATAFVLARSDGQRRKLAAAWLVAGELSLVGDPTTGRLKKAVSQKTTTAI